MELGLENRVAVVLASTGGLGFAVARALLAEGAAVAISGRDEARMHRALDELAVFGGRVVGEVLDVSEPRALRNHLEHAAGRFGHSVDILVTNAGGPPPASALEVDDEGLERACQLTLRSAVHAVQTVLPGMRERGFGRIVGLTSSSVRIPIPTLVYSNMLRAALTSYLKTLAGAVAKDGVLVNTVCTGSFATERLDELFTSLSSKSGRSVAEERASHLERIPLRRLGTPAEFGDFVAFLCSPRCSYLTGTAISLDGGANPALL